MTPNTELYFPVVLCKIQLKEILTFESVDEILFSLKHLNESYWTFSSRNICYCVKEYTRWFQLLSQRMNFSSVQIHVEN